MDPASFRNAMSRLGAAVNVITTDGPAGRHGFTASAVCSVTDSPPTLLVCMNKTARAHDAFLTNKALAVNTLAPGHEALSNCFSKRDQTMEGRFACADWKTLRTGAPLLTGAAVNFDCSIAETYEVGTHTILFCLVEGVSLGDQSAGLIYFDRAYHPVRTA